MLLTLLEHITIRKFLIEDFLLKWVDNKNNLFNNGLELDMYQKHLKHHLIKDNNKIENNLTSKIKKYNQTHNQKIKILLNNKLFKSNKH